MNRSRTWIGILKRWLRPVSHAGVPVDATRAQERELVTANVVVIFSIIATSQHAIDFISIPGVVAERAALVASLTVAAYAIGFALICLGRRFAGVLVFSNAVLVNLAALTIILGTRSGVQYYFIAVGMGVMFVWPRAHKPMRALQGALGLVTFVVVMHFAGNDPAAGAALPADVTASVFNRTTIGAYAITFALAYFSLSATEGAESALEKEHEKSEALLLNVLPQAIAARLKDSDQAIADGFDDVTILFADVVGFTPMAERVAPAAVVAFLNGIFSEFDRMAERHGLEKIKTIGDAYMVAGGIPQWRSDHAKAVAEMALEMQDFARTRVTPTGQPLLLRIGIDSGPAIAGVIGLRKFSYDLWGDTVNTAARMESHGVPGTIQVTQRLRSALQSDYGFEDRGTWEIKGKGLMPLYLLHRKPQVAS